MTAATPPPAIMSALDWAVEAAVESAYERAVLIELARRAHRASGQVQASREELAAAARISVATFRRAVAALSAPGRGLIAVSVSRGPHGGLEAAIYTLTDWLSRRGVGPVATAAGADNVVSMTPSALTEPTPSALTEPTPSALTEPTPLGSHRADPIRSVSIAARPHYRGPALTEPTPSALTEPRGVVEAVPLSPPHPLSPLEPPLPLTPTPLPPLAAAAVDAGGREQAPGRTCGRADGQADGRAGAGSDVGVAAIEAASIEMAAEPPRAVWLAWSQRLVETAGPGLADPAREAHLILSGYELASWAKAGVDLELDAVPAVGALSARAAATGKGPIRTWTYFRAAVIEARDRRRAAEAAIATPQLNAPASSEFQPQTGGDHVPSSSAGRAASGGFDPREQRRRRRAIGLAVAASLDLAAGQ